MPDWRARRWPTSLIFRTCIRPTPSAPGNATTWDGDPAELEKIYNFRKRIREEKVIYDECDVVLATTPQQRDLLVCEDSEYDVPPPKIAVIPPGYDDTRFFPVARATRQALKSDLELEGRIVLAIGRIAKNKGYDLLIRAFKSVARKLEDARLLLAVGSTQPSESETRQVNSLRAIARELGIEDKVLFRDYIPDEQLPDYYRAADVFALSSRYEPFGMTAVEAMACGTPAVVTTEGGLWEQITWGLDAIYANPFEPDEFGHALLSVLKYPRVHGQLAKFGSQKARAKFTWNGVAQQLLRVLQQARAQQRTGSPTHVCRGRALDGRSLLITDVDGTMLGNEAGLAEFNRWHAARRDELAIVYASGRFVHSVLQSIEENTAPPARGRHWRGSARRSACRTEPRWATGRNPCPKTGTARGCANCWPTSQTCSRKPDHLLSDWKKSYFLYDATSARLEQLQQKLAAASLSTEIIYSSNRDLDFLPAAVNKGAAARWLAQYWQTADERVFVSGDSGNDLTLFEQGFRGIVVGNAHTELKTLDSDRVFHARGHCAAGVLEGLLHWRDSLT